MTMERIPREISPYLALAASFYSASVLLGPRGSGKTSLARTLFPYKRYVNFEDPETRAYARERPREFLLQFDTDGAILDEIGLVPELLPFLFELLRKRGNKDREYFSQTPPGWGGRHVNIGEEQPTLRKKPYYKGFILITSNSFLNMHINFPKNGIREYNSVSLLPLSMRELREVGMEEGQYSEYLIRGMYPGISHNPVHPSDFYTDYLRRYLEEDLKQFSTISAFRPSNKKTQSDGDPRKNVFWHFSYSENVHLDDTSTFQHFLKLCALHSGQILDHHFLAGECGIETGVVFDWVKLLQESFMISLLPSNVPDVQKLYFRDPGLAAYLAGIRDPKEISEHPLRNALFETLIIAEFEKYCKNYGIFWNNSFWRDNHGNEVKCILSGWDANPIPVDIRSDCSLNDDLFTGLNSCYHNAKTPPESSFVVYGGDGTQKRKSGTAISFKDLSSITNLLK